MIGWEEAQQNASSWTPNHKVSVARLAEAAAQGQVFARIGRQRLEGVHVLRQLFPGS